MGSIRIRYTTIVRRDQDTALSLQYQQRLGTTLYFGGELRKLKRQSTVPGSSYVENRAILSLVYRQ